MRALGYLEILEHLVSYPTISSASNLPMIDWVRNYLADFGITSNLVPDTTGRKANLFATIGPQVEGGLVLSGHTDVVPTDDQAWSTDPFHLTRLGTRLYARGACDMKGFIAVVLSRLPVSQSRNLARPVHVMLSYDEEVGCLGAPSMIAAAREKLPAPGAVVVGEPTGMRVATSHKGVRILRTHIRGIEAHSSLTHQGVSAVMIGGRLVAHLDAIAHRLASAPRQAGEGELEPPYTSLSVNHIIGGTGFNILAGSCEFLWDIRTLPGESAEDICKELDAFVAAQSSGLSREGRRCSVETRILADVPPLRALEGAAAALARSALECDIEDSISVPFASEGGQFQQAGWSTVVCGPGRIEQAHQPDEFIELSQLAACESFVDRMVGQQCERS